MEYPVITTNDGVTPAPLLTATLQAGDTEGPLEYWIVNDPGETHADADTISGAFLKLEAFDSASGRWVEEGLPILDEKWVKVTLFGVNDPHSNMVNQVTGTIGLGNGGVIELGDITKGSARKFNVRVDSPGTADGVVQWRLKVVTKQNTLTIGEKLELVSGSGVVPARMMPGLRQIVAGALVTASGTDTIHVEERLMDYDGVRYAFISHDVVLNQNDSAAAALAAGESYLAVISQGTGANPTATKGVKAAVPAAPALPAGEIPISTITVGYQAGGTSVINQANVDQTGMVVGDFEVSIGTGLNVVVSGGHGFAGDSFQFSNIYQTVGVADNSTNYLWRNEDASFSTTTTPTAPSFGSDLVARITTAAGTITLLEDLREIITPAITSVVLVASISDLLSTQANARLSPLVILQESMELHEVSLDLSETDANWTGQSVKIDVFSIDPGQPASGAGTTIYTDSATQDLRPSIAYNAAAGSLRTTSSYHQVRRFYRGTRFYAKLVAVPTTGAGETAHTAVVGLHFRRGA